MCEVRRSTRGLCSTEGSESHITKYQTISNLLMGVSITKMIMGDWLFSVDQG